jgi:glutathione reductase (NADPH)
VPLHCCYTSPAVCSCLTTVLRLCSTRLVRTGSDDCRFALGAHSDFRLTVSLPLCFLCHQHLSAVREALHDAKEYGFTGFDDDAIQFDWPHLKSKRDAYVARLNGIYAKNLQNDKVTHIQGHGSFTAAKTVRVNGKDYTADHIVVATGGYPLMGEKDIEGALEHAISSDGFFELPFQPKKVAVVGAGYIAVELAGIFNALGTETHLFVRQDKALRKFDALLTDTLDDEMKKSGIHMHTQVLLNAVKKDGTTQEGRDQLTLKYTQAAAAGAARENKTLSGFDAVLLAIGRGPKTAKLNLEAASVRTKEGGYISVDEYQNTSAPGVYALGDVCGHVELTPVAIAAGRQLAERLFNNQHHAKLNYEQVKLSSS